MKKILKRILKNIELKLGKLLKLVDRVMSVAHRKTPRAASASWRWRVFLSVIGIEFVGSRHLVFN
jgi:hypothetical protein